MKQFKVTRKERKRGTADSGLQVVNLGSVSECYISYKTGSSAAFDAALTFFVRLILWRH